MYAIKLEIKKYENTSKWKLTQLCPRYASTSKAYQDSFLSSIAPFFPEKIENLASCTNTKI